MKEYAVPKRNRILIAIGVIGILAMFAVCACTAVSIFGSVSDELYAERAMNLSEVSEQIAKTIHATCRSSWDVADAAFSHMLSTEMEDRESLAALLAEAESGPYAFPYRMIAIDSRTNYYLSDGGTGLFRNVGFLMEEADERQVVMTTVTFESDHEYMIFLRRLNEPLLLKDGTQITHIAMILPPEAYVPAFSCSGFDGSADVFIVHTDGRSIYRQDNTGNFSISANIMRTLENVSFLHGGTFAQLMESLAHPTGESHEFIYENTNYFVSLAPVGIPDWVVVLIVPTGQMNSGSENLLHNTMNQMITISAIGVLIAALILFCFISAENMRIRAAQQKQVNDALQKAAEEATRANRAKSELLSQISHDLRTPLNGIMGMLERAQACPDTSEELQHCLSGMQTASQHLCALINDILDVRRLETGKDTPVEHPFDLRSVMDACCSILQSNAKQSDVAFLYRCDGFRHPYVIGYDLYLRQVLINVLGNAVKFTRAGGSVTFEAAEIASEGETASFRFVISDTGVGMKEGYRERIFEPFWQENNQIRPGQQGTGLGMTIVKRLVDRMNGTIEVDSKEKVGTCFTIVLPFTVCREGLPEPEEDAALVPDALKGMRILLAEDNMLNRDIAEHILTKAGASVVVACDGEEAVEAFEASDVGSIHVVLMDVMMPVMDGLEATGAIRSLNRPDAKSVPIVAMTANAFDEDVKRTLAAGMNEHLSKPICEKILVSSLIKYRNGNNG